MSSPCFLKYASIILDLYLDKMLDYGVPEPLTSSIKKGMMVEVPVKGRLTKGYVADIKDQTKLFSC